MARDCDEPHDYEIMSAGIDGIVDGDPSRLVLALEEGGRSYIQIMQ